VIRSFGFHPFYEGDAGGGAGGAPPAAAPAPAPAAAPAAAAASPDRVAQLERELNDARTKLTAREQAEAESARKQAEEQGNFKKLYEEAQAALTKAEQTRAAERATEATKQAQLTAATAAGLDASLATRLVGDTPEALLADAKALAARLAPSAPGTGSTNPSATRGVATVEDQINSEWAKRKKGGFRF
jgi:alanyl-tRNA synthetase